MSVGPGWWRRNRWWLVALPVAIVLMVVASGYRVQTWWWDSGLHDRVGHAEAGKWVRVTLPFKDAVGETTRTFEVRALGVRPAARIPSGGLAERDVPPGVTAHAVELEFRADPGQDLNYCFVRLVDADGVRYGGSSPDAMRQSNLCLPEDTPGPAKPLAEGQQRGVVKPGEERPRTWTVRPLVLMAAGESPREVWLSFENPRYVVLELPD